MHYCRPRLYSTFPELSSVATTRCKAVLKGSGVVTVRQVHRAYANAAEVAFNEFEQTHPNAREWFLHEGTMQALAFCSSKSRKWSSLQVKSLENIAEKLLAFHRQSGKDALNASIAADLAAHFNHSNGMARDSKYYLSFSLNVHNGIRGVLGSHLGEDYASAKNNLARCFDCAQNAVETTFVKRRRKGQ